MTRKALELIRKSFDNNAEFISSLFSDPAFKLKLRIIINDLEDVYQEYTMCNQMHKEGRDQMMEYVAQRSYGKVYMSTVTKMIRRITSPRIATYLGLTPPGATPLSCCTAHVKNQGVIFSFGKLSFFSLVLFQISFRFFLLVNQCFF